jgi:hypothetical protein
VLGGRVINMTFMMLLKKDKLDLAVAIARSLHYFLGSILTKAMEG